MTLRFCKKCLYSSDHPLGIIINEEGICSGCVIHEEKNTLDWIFRWEKLKKLTNGYKSRTKENYDCIIPVTGSQDSYFIVHIVKNKLGLNPLLVNYNKYFNTPLGIRNLSNLRIKFDCDILIQNVNPISVKKITKTTLRKFGSMYWPILAGHSVFPVQVAINHKIPLIIWGAHQGLEQVGMFSHLHEVEMTRRYRKDHDLMGFEADDLISNFDILNEEDVWQYRYPDDNSINEIGVKGIYLGNYIKWDPKDQHELMIDKYDYKTSSFSRTFDCYDYVDCFNYLDIHDLLKLYKNGYSKVTDHACREIRFKRISKEQGLNLVNHYERKPIKYLKNFCNWLEISPEALNFVINQHRNMSYWIKKSPTEYSFNGLSKQNFTITKNFENLKEIFSSNSRLEYNSNDEYVIFGKGYP